MANPKTSLHNKVVHFEHGPSIASGDNLLSVASINSAVNPNNPASNSTNSTSSSTKFFELWTEAVDLYFELNLKSSAKKHRQLLRDLRLLVPTQQPENLLTPEIKKLTAYLWFNLGQVKNLEGHDSIACEAYNLSVKVDEKFALAWYALGISYFKLDSFKKSERAFRTCLDIFDAMGTKSIEYDLRVTLEDEAKLASEMEGGDATISASENGASITMQEKHSALGRIKKFVLGHGPVKHNMELAELDKVLRATKVQVSPDDKTKLIAPPDNVMYTPARYQTVVNSTPYDVFYNRVKADEREEQELHGPVCGYHDALTEIASSSKENLVASSSKGNEAASSVKEQEIVPTVSEKEVTTSTEEKKKKSKPKRKGKGKNIDAHGEEKIVDTKGAENIVNTKGKETIVEAEDQQKIVDMAAEYKKIHMKGDGKIIGDKGRKRMFNLKGKGKMVDLKANEELIDVKMDDKKQDVKGKGKMIDTKGKDMKEDSKGKAKSKPYVSKRPEVKLRQPAEVELWNFANAHKEQQVIPLWLTKYRAIEEHFDDYHSLLPARDIDLDTFYRDAKNAVINDKYLYTAQFDKNIPPLEDSLRGVDEFYRKAFREIPDLDGEEEWYCSITDMFFGRKQNLDLLEEIEKLSVKESSLIGNITTEEYIMEMKKFVGIDAPSFADNPLPDLPIAAQIVNHNKDRRDLAKSIGAKMKANEAAKEPVIDYTVTVKVTDSEVVYLGHRSSDPLATGVTHASTGSTAASTHFGSTFTGTEIVLHTPFTPATGLVDAGPAILLSPADIAASPRWIEPEFEIGLPGMRTTLPHQESKKEDEGHQEVQYMPDGVTPLQKGTGDGIVVEGMGPGEMLYPTVFEGF
ncbi:hypothetical protein MMC11_002735 [Xylographa trunciseda]|nr:hypothetical protein [Xylographa trunciseda]